MGNQDVMGNQHAIGIGCSTAPCLARIDRRNTATVAHENAPQRSTNDEWQGTVFLVLKHHVWNRVWVFGDAKRCLSKNITNTIWLFNIAMERSTIFKNGKPSINGPFSMAMLNNQTVKSHLKSCHSHTQLLHHSIIARSLRHHLWGTHTLARIGLGLLVVNQYIYIYTSSYLYL